MLEHIQSFIGGKVRVSSDETEVLWVADDQTVIKRILHIFDRYPPLTSRVTLQLSRRFASPPPCGGGLKISEFSHKN